MAENIVGNADMEVSNVQFGDQTASNVRESSEIRTNLLRSITTLADLLAALAQEPPSKFPMLRTTAGHLASFMGRTPHEITIEKILVVRDGFRLFLERQRYKESSIRTYVNYVRILLDQARRLGWRPGDGLSEQWRSILETAKQRRCGVLARHMALLGKAPSEVTVEDVNSWINDRVQQGRSYGYEKQKKSIFWRLLSDGGHLAPGAKAPLRPSRYGIALARLPWKLKSEVTEILRWKTAEYAIDRPREARIREVTAKDLKHLFSMVSGFAINVRGDQHVSSIHQLITKQTITAYIEWSINERQTKGRSLYGYLNLLLSAVRQHPAYRDLDLSWVKPVLDSIPLEPVSEVRARKAAKYLEYSVLESIPAKIRSLRSATARHGAHEVARLVMDELLMKLLVVLVWRQRNARECRINGPNPNLFKRKIDPLAAVHKPQWVVEAERRDPATAFWQFKFNRHETKTGIDVHAVLPRPLVPVLEEYLHEFRTQLIGPVDPLTLFVNNEGRPMSENEVNDRVSELTIRHGGKRVNPHLFRDVVAFAWLETHPEDFLTLSKLLWHKKVQTTIEIYGSRYNESSGVRAMESWVEQREKGAK